MTTATRVAHPTAVSTPAPRIRPVAGRRRGVLLRLLNRLARHQFGQESLPLNVIAHNPRFILPFVGMLGLVQSRTRLDPALRALAMHLTAQRHGCSWCIDFGGAVFQQQGVPAAKLAAVLDYATDPSFTPAERAALAFADAMTRDGGQVPDDVFAEARRHFSEREIVELAVAAAAETMFSRLNNALGITAQGFCALGPLPPSPSPIKGEGAAARGSRRVPFPS